MTAGYSICHFAQPVGGVTIDPVSGSFDGYAWGENVGWIHFKGTAPEYNVVTTFRPPVVGGYTEPLRALLWSWLLLAAAVVTGAFAAVMLRRRPA